MFSNTSLRFSAVFVVMLGLVSLDASAQQCPRRIVRLEMIPLGSLGGEGGYASSVNKRGQVVGRSTLADGSSASFMWDCARGMSRFPGEGSAELINNRGQVAGTLDGKAFLWSIGSGTHLIGEGSPSSLNDVGDVGLGNYWNDIDGSLYTAATGLVPLSSLTGITWREVFVNNRRQAAGYVFQNDDNDMGSSQAGFATWTARQGMRVFDLGVQSNDPGYSYPLRDFNDRGDALFELSLYNATLPFILKNDGTIQYLVETEGKRVFSIAFNNLRQVIGWSAEGSKYFLWQPNEFSDLELLTFGHRRDRITGAGAINDWGWITAAVRLVGSSVSEPALLVSVPYRDPNFTNLARLRGERLCTALNSLAAMARKTDAACQARGTQP